jgi:DNA-binding transcriptional ArsR family regulator
MSSVLRTSLLALLQRVSKKNGATASDMNKAIGMPHSTIGSTISGYTPTKLVETVGERTAGIPRLYRITKTGRAEIAAFGEGELMSDEEIYDWAKAKYDHKIAYSKGQPKGLPRIAAPQMSKTGSRALDGIADILHENSGLRAALTRVKSELNQTIKTIDSLLSVNDEDASNE